MVTVIETWTARIMIFVICMEFLAAMVLFDKKLINDKIRKKGEIVLILLLLAELGVIIAARMGYIQL